MAYIASQGSQMLEKFRNFEDPEKDSLLGEDENLQIMSPAETEMLTEDDMELPELLSCHLYQLEEGKAAILETEIFITQTASFLMTSNMDVRHEQIEVIEFLCHEGIKQVELVETL